MPAAAAGLDEASGEADRFFREHSSWLLAYCTGRLGSREEGEDAVQSVYVNALRALQRGTEPRSPAAWLQIVARNVCHERLRARSERWTRELPVDPDRLAQAIVPAPAAAAVEDTDELSTAVRGLPENQKRALLLREWRGLSYHEIAAELAVSHTAVEMLLFRARRAVAARLKAAAVGPARSVGAVLPLAEILRGARDAMAALSPAKAAATVVAVVAAPAVTVGVIAHERGTANAPAAARTAAAPAPFLRGADAASFVRPPAGGTVAQEARRPPRVDELRPARRGGGGVAAPRPQAGAAAGGTKPAAGAGATAGAGGGGGAVPGNAAPPDTAPAVAPPAADAPSGGSAPVAPPPAPPPASQPDQGGGSGGGGGGGRPKPPRGATPATPATPNGPGVPATPATPATPPPHAQDGNGQGSPPPGGNRGGKKGG